MDSEPTEEGQKALAAEQSHALFNAMELLRCTIDLPAEYRELEDLRALFASPETENEEKSSDEF